MKKTARQLMVKEIQTEIRSRRSHSVTKLVDIERILTCMNNRDYEPMFKTKLYNEHGGEYSELLSVIHGVYQIEVNTSI